MKLSTHKTLAEAKRAAAAARKTRFSVIPSTQVIEGRKIYVVYGGKLKSAGPKRRAKRVVRRKARRRVARRR